MNTKITIIIPFYNAECFVERCVRSLFSQTYTDFKAILINDGSKDKTRELLKKYVEQDKRFTYIEKENGGEGSARNAGLEILDTPYVFFLDCDDEIPEDTVETYMKYIGTADLIVGGIKKKTSKKTKIYLPQEKMVTGRKKIAESVIYDMCFINPICSKLYRTDLLKKNKIMFNNFKFGEDTDFTYRYLYVAENILYIEKVVYCINEVAGSMSLRPVPMVGIYMKAIYENGSQLDLENQWFQYMLFLRTIKTTLLVKIREGKKEFMSACNDMYHYTGQSNINMNIRGGIYNKFILRNLMNMRFNMLYFVLKIRTLLGV